MISRGDRNIGGVDGSFRVPLYSPEIVIVFMGIASKSPA
jgi:hypothetical protein